MEFPPFALIFDDFMSKYRAYQDKALVELHICLNLNTFFK